MKTFSQSIVLCLFALISLGNFLNTTTQLPTTKTKHNHTTLAPTTAVACEQRNTSCDYCSEDSTCYWCAPFATCKKYPVSHIVPTDCKGNKWYWKQCLIPGFVLIIVVPSLAGLILLTCGCCIYCKCCRTRSRKYDKDDGKFRRKRQEIKQRNEERRAQRRQRTDAIRKKYGLLKDEDDDGDDGGNQIV